VDGVSQGVAFDGALCLVPGLLLVLVSCVSTSTLLDPRVLPELVRLRSAWRLRSVGCWSPGGTSCMLTIQLTFRSVCAADVSRAKPLRFCVGTGSNGNSDFHLLDPAAPVRRRHCALRLLPHVSFCLRFPVYLTACVPQASRPSAPCPCFAQPRAPAKSAISSSKADATPGSDVISSAAS
jgi:hypothetical protein